MRIATWNVNSLKARMEAVENWLDRAEPDVLLLQETKLADADAPVMPFRMRGYELVHHGEGRWNGVAILSRVGAADVVANFGDGPVRDSSAGAAGTAAEDDFDPFREARMVSAVCGGVRLVSLYAPNGREVDSPFYEGKLAWFARLRRWLGETQSPEAPIVLGGDISRAADELRAVGIPIIALNMVGSITEHVDLVVSDPVQAGTMAVMAVADTATFELARQRGRRL